MLDSRSDETYSSFRHMYTLANVVCCIIRSVYPESKKPFVKRNDLNLTIYPRVKTGKRGVHIMVTHNKYRFRKRLAAKPFCYFDP